MSQNAPYLSLGNAPAPAKSIQRYEELGTIPSASQQPKKIADAYLSLGFDAKKPSTERSNLQSTKPKRNEAAATVYEQRIRDESNRRPLDEMRSVKRSTSGPVKSLAPIKSTALVTRASDSEYGPDYGFRKMPDGRRIPLPFFYPPKDEGCNWKKCCVIASIVVLVLVVLGGIGVGLYFGVFAKKDGSTPASVTTSVQTSTASTTTSTKAKTTIKPFAPSGPQLFRDGVCLQRSPKVKPLCIVGSPPDKNSCQTGICTTFAYNMVEKGTSAFDFEIKTSPENVSTTLPTDASDQQHLCRDQNNVVLGVCSKDGKCDRSYGGFDDETAWEQPGKWVDNCDDKNDCWNESATQFDQFKNVTSREECKKASKARCQVAGTNAVVWMQHQRCKTGENRTTLNPCKGLPLKLRRCAACRLPNPWPPPNSTCKQTGCVYQCNGQRPAAMPNGASCGEDAYCFLGFCFDVDVTYLPSEILSKSDCDRKKQDDV